MDDKKMFSRSPKMTAGSDGAKTKFRTLGRFSLREAMHLKQLCIRGGCRNNGGARCNGQLECEDGHTAGALDEDHLASLEGNGLNKDVVGG